MAGRQIVSGAVLAVVTALAVGACSGPENADVFDAPADVTASGPDSKQDEVVTVEAPEMEPVESVDLDRDYSWMAEELDFREKRRVSIENCMHDLGFTGIVVDRDAYGMSGNLAGTSYEGNTQEELVNLFFEATSKCEETTPYKTDDDPDEVYLDEYLEIYDSLLDTMACVTDLGYEIPNPPARDVWAERRFEVSYAVHHDLITDSVQESKLLYESDNAWSPFNEIRKQVFAGEITQTEEEFNELFDSCIDRWGQTWDPHDLRIR